MKTLKSRPKMVKISAGTEITESAYKKNKASSEFKKAMKREAEGFKRIGLPPDEKDCRILAWVWQVKPIDVAEQLRKNFMKSFKK